LYVDSPLQRTTRTLSREEQVINSRLSSYLNKLRLAKTEKKYKDQAIKDEHRFNNEMDNYRKNVPFPPTAQDIDFRCTIDLYHADIRSSGTGTRQPLDDSLPPKDGWYKSSYNGSGYLSLKPDDFDIYLDTNMSIGPRVYLTPADLPSLQEFEDSAYRAAYRLYYNVRRVVDKYQPTPTKILWGHEGSIILTGSKEINDELSRNRALESIINSKEPRNISLVAQLHEIVQQKMIELDKKGFVDRVKKPMYNKPSLKNKKTNKIRKKKKIGRPKLSTGVIAERIASGLYRKIPCGQLKKLCTKKECTKLAAIEGLCLKHCHRIRKQKEVINPKAKAKAKMLLARKEPINSSCILNMNSKQIKKSDQACCIS